MVKPSEKGGAFERKLCKLLSLWVSGGRHTDLFWRTAMSGGRATVHHRRGVVVRQGGDICSVTPEGHELTDYWFIECKHVKRLALDQFAVKGTGPLAQFWKKTQREAYKYNREPMIIARQNGWPVLVITKPDATRHWFPPFLQVRRAAVSKSALRYKCDITVLDSLLAQNFKRGEE